MINNIIMMLVTCFLALVFSISTASSGCVRFKHMVRSDAADITVTVSNITSAEQEDDIPRGDYHRFQINSFTGLELTTQYNTDTHWTGLSYDAIFPLTDSSVCRSVVGESRAGGCADGGCCGVTINAYSVYDEDNGSTYIVMRARTNIINDQGIHEFWICEHEFHGTQTITEEESLVRRRRDTGSEEESRIRRQSEHSRVRRDTAECEVACGVNGTCPFKGSNTTCECDSGFSGATCCYENNVAYQGNTTSSFTITDVNSTEKCHEKCQKRADCEAWVYTSSNTNKVCFLKSEKGEEVTSNVTTSGPKWCAGVDQCTAGTDDCDSNALCTDTEESFTCTCNSGFTGDGYTCTDINECSEGACSGAAYASCNNSVGSYSCACNSGYGVDTTSKICNALCNTHGCVNGTCTAPDDCTCDLGWKGDDCSEDINECDVGACNSTAYANCTNSVGSYSCACNSGYELDTTGKICNDIDECASNTTYDCTIDNTVCNNTEGSYGCICPEGYQENVDSRTDTTTCTDINECAASPSPCSGSAYKNCTNSAGSYSCGCNPGYGSDTTGKICNDIDECDDECQVVSGGAYANCTNSVGSYSCACNSGYELDTTSKICTVYPDCESNDDRARRCRTSCSAGFTHLTDFYCGGTKKCCKQE